MEKKLLFNVKNKKAISTIIATLLIIVLAIASVGVVWVVVQGIVEEKIDDTEKCSNLFEKIELEEKLTCYNSEELQFSINIGDIDVEKILVSISKEEHAGSFEIYDGARYSYVKNYGGTYNSDLTLGEKNSGKTYVMLLDSDLVTGITGSTITGFATTCQARDVYTLREGDFTPSSKAEGDAKCAQYLPGYHWCEKSELDNIYGNVVGQTGTGATGTRSIVYDSSSNCKGNVGVCSSANWWQCTSLVCEQRFCTGQALVCCDDSGTYTINLEDPNPPSDPVLWDEDFCSTSSPCQAGQGDCDTNNECLTNLCSQDVGLNYGQESTMDVCECSSGTTWDSSSNSCISDSSETPPVTDPVLWDEDYCSTSSPCKAGEGDCDTNNECLTGLCSQDVGLNYGQSSSMDVCECPSGTIWSSISNSCIEESTESPSTIEGAPDKIDIAPVIEGKQCGIVDSIFNILPC